MLYLVFFGWLTMSSWAPWIPYQEIEDLNVMHKFDRRLERLAMVMPLTDQFDPGVTHFAHEHLQVCTRSVGDE